MKALSLTQPMAWAIFHGKDVENRTLVDKVPRAGVHPCFEGFQLCTL